MTPLEQVLPILEQLSREDKILVIERLTCLLNQEEVQARLPRNILKGLWADLKVDVSEEDIAEVRREMMKNFPREDI
jgi:hypothetical protein